MIISQPKFYHIFIEKTRTFYTYSQKTACAVSAAQAVELSVFVVDKIRGFIGVDKAIEQVNRTD